MHQHRMTMDWNVPAIDDNLGLTQLNDTAMVQSLRTTWWNITAMDRALSSWIDKLHENSWWITSALRIRFVIYTFQYFYYPILAIIGVPGKSQ